MSSFAHFHGRMLKGSVFALARNALKRSFSTKSDLELLQCFQFNPKTESPLVSLTDFRGGQAGLFDRRELRDPSGFRLASNRAFSLCSELVSMVVSSHTRQDLEGAKMLVKRLDRLSEILCSVVDTAELVRHVHPALDWCNEAEQAHQKITRFLNQLNTNVELYAALDSALSSPQISGAWSSTEKRVAEMLRRDFQKSAIHLPEKQRQRFVELNEEIMDAGTQFCGPSPASKKSVLEIAGPPDVVLQGLPPSVIARLSNFRQTKVCIPLTSANSPEEFAGLARYIVNHCSNRETRRLTQTALNAPDEYKLEKLTVMLSKRQQLANVAGKSSYGELALADAMLTHPEQVVEFMEGLAKKGKVAAGSSLARYASKGLASVEEYDLGFLERCFTPSALNPSLNAYISVGGAICGLFKLLNALYGLRLEMATVKPGELWHEDVRKVKVLDSKNRHMGDLYLDLFERNGQSGASKYSMPAHFTVQCSRLLTNDESIFGNRENVYHTEDASERQLPKVVLVCAFPKGPNGLGLIAWSSVEALCHEMGHAMHSMLGQTDFQHISGTRTQMDFVELPSIFMEELLCSSPAVWRLFSVNAKNGEPLPSFLEPALKQLASKKDNIETQFHNVMAIVDQYYHHPPLASGVLPDGKYSTEKLTEIFHKLQSRLHVVPPLPNTAWQTNFTHLFPYGAGYYTYAWSRQWARKIVKKWFGALGDSESVVRKDSEVRHMLGDGGSELFRHVLKPGASKDGWEILTDSKLVNL